MTTSRHITVAVALSLLSVTGCAMFSTGNDDVLSSSEALKPSQVAEPNDSAPVRHVVRVNASIVTALSTDKRLREHAWTTLDECGPMSPEDRRRLNQSGIRVGVSGGSLPWALSNLLSGERSQQQKTAATNQHISPNGQTSSFGSHVAIPEGSSSIIELPNRDAELNVPAGRLAGMYKGAELKNARCVLQMTATEYGDGWVIVRFLPQIHHGAMTARYSVADNVGQLPTRQLIHPLYEQQFELKLHANETVVIGHQLQDDWTVGRLLFQEDTLAAVNEHLMVLKLEQIEAVRGQKSVTINYRKF